MSKKSFQERISSGEPIIVAEGYLFEMQRRGHLSAGRFTPEVVLTNPEAVKQLTKEFMACGSDVSLALTYYGHREKLSLAGRADDTEKLNRIALKIAREEADNNNGLFAGNLSNNPCFDPEMPKQIEKCREHAAEQVALAKEAGVDFIIGETFSHSLEAIIALEEIKKAHLPAMITMAAHPSGKSIDGRDHVEVLQDLKQRGADVVGLNCSMGCIDPTFVANMRRIREGVEGPLAMVPSPYRTENSMFFEFELPDGTRAFQEDLDRFLNSKAEIHEFGKLCKEIGIQFVGLCCGNAPAYTRALAESLNRNTSASKYSTDLTKHLSAKTQNGVRPEYRIAHGNYLHMKPVA